MPNVEKISVALTSEQISAVRAAVETGAYATTSEVIREALRDWEWNRTLRNDELDRLRKSWHQGKSSGPATTFNLTAARKQAQRKLKRSAGVSA